MGAEERGSFRIGMQDAAAGWGCGDGEEEGGHGAVLAKKPPPPVRAPFALRSSARSLCTPRPPRGGSEVSVRLSPGPSRAPRACRPWSSRSSSRKRPGVV